MAHGYEVLTDELTIHRQVGDLTDPISGRVIGIQQGQGKTYVRGEVVPEDAVSPVLRDALEDENNPLHESVSQKLRKTSDEERVNLEARLGVPFAGYDDMDEDAIIGAMVNLPSPTIQAIKEYESANENRDRIANYNIGYGESPTDRQEGRVSSDLEDADESKEVNKLTTREVPEEGLVQVGEGITGTGDPQKPYGSEKESDGETRSTSARRRSRRARTTQSTEGGGSSSEGGSE